MEHETRAHALAVFTQRTASSKEIAEELDLSVSAVWYHVKKLRDLGCIELVRSERRRGAREHFYRATVRHFFDAEAWDAVPEKKRMPITMGVLRLIGEDIDEAVRAEAFISPDWHLSRTLLDLDVTGQREAYELLSETLEGLLQIRENCADRRRKRKRPVETLRISVAVMQMLLSGDEAAGKAA